MPCILLQCKWPFGSFAFTKLTDWLIKTVTQGVNSAFSLDQFVLNCCSTNTRLQCRRPTPLYLPSSGIRIVLWTSEDVYETSRDHKMVGEGGTLWRLNDRSTPHNLPHTTDQRLTDRQRLWNVLSTDINHVSTQYGDDDIDPWCTLTCVNTLIIII